MANQNQIDSTTQQFLDIFDIVNNLVILKDGTASLIITVDAMNFGLLADEEQDSIMYAYAGLLNSLNYTIQIVIKSQTKDVTGYLKLLKEQEDATVNRVQQQRILKYREFVSNLIRERNVLDKKFYVVIPAQALELGIVPISGVLPGQGQTDVSTVDKSLLIEKARNILEPKKDHLIAQFARIGLYSRQLETQEIIQLFYQSYNPEAFEGQHMDDSRNYSAPLVSASTGDIFMNVQDPQQQAVEQAAATVQTEQPAAPAAEPVMTPAMPAAAAEIPVVEQTPPAPEAVIPVQTQPLNGYTPTQMPSAAPAVAPTIEALPQTDVAPALPPMPELPKTQPGQTDPAIPQEVNVAIAHQGEQTQEVAAAPQNQQSLPPLPEIQ